MYDSLYGTVNTNKIYEEGLHVCFLTKYFIKYPRFYKHLVFSDNYDNDIDVFEIDKPAFESRSKEGVSVKFDIIIYYKLIKEQLIKLNYKFGRKKYEKVFLKEAMNTIFLVCGQFSALEITGNDRSNFTTTILNNLQESFNKYEGIVEIKDVLLSQIIIWELLETSIEEKLIEQQKNEELTLQKDIDLINKNKEVYYNEKKKLYIDKNDAIADSKILIFEEITEKNKTIYETSQLIDYFQYIETEYNTPNDYEFGKNFYYYSNVLSKKDNIRFIFNLLENENNFDVSYNETV